MIEQDKFTYSLLAKALEKQRKIYEAQGKNKQKPSNIMETNWMNLINL